MCLPPSPSPGPGPVVSPAEGYFVFLGHGQAVPGSLGVFMLGPFLEM